MLRGFGALRRRSLAVLSLAEASSSTSTARFRAGPRDGCCNASNRLCNLSLPPSDMLPVLLLPLDAAAADDDVLGARRLATPEVVLPLLLPLPNGLKCFDTYDVTLWNRRIEVPNTDVIAASHRIFFLSETSCKSCSFMYFQSCFTASDRASCIGADVLPASSCENAAEACNGLKLCVGGGGDRAWYVKPYV